MKRPRSHRLFAMNSPHPVSVLTALAFALTLGAGCSQRLETVYGASQGYSLNGTSALAELVSREGNEVRTAWRLTDELSDWADVIVRFASIPGPPDREEAEWYMEWLQSRPGLGLVYVVRDYDAQADYWRMIVDQLGGPADEARRKLAEEQLEESKDWVARLPTKTTKSADPQTWFTVHKAISPPAICKILAGPWAKEVDADAAGLPIHEPLEAKGRGILLSGDGHALAMEWSVGSGSQVLAIANGSFLLNLALVNPARRPLAERVVDWIGDVPKHVAFVDGPSVAGSSQLPPSLLDLLERISSFRWVAIHLGLFGLLACLARAPRLGPPQPDTPSDAERPAAHAEALGALLERSRSSTTARELLEAYRRWRSQRTSPQAGHGSKATAKPQ
jgi:hypothetical protein